MSLSSTLQSLGRSVAFHPSLNHITGGCLETLFLEQLAYRLGQTEDPDGVYKTAKDWEEETGLTVAEQKTARKRLKAKGLLIEKYKGMPRKIYYKIDRERLDLLWNQYVQGEASAKCDRKKRTEAATKASLKSRKKKPHNERNADPITNVSHNKANARYIVSETFDQERAKRSDNHIYPLEDFNRKQKEDPDCSSFCPSPLREMTTEGDLNSLETPKRKEETPPPTPSPSTRTHNDFALASQSHNDFAWIDAADAYERYRSDPTNGGLRQELSIAIRKAGLPPWRTGTGMNDWNLEILQVWAEYRTRKFGKTISTVDVKKYIRGRENPNSQSFFDGFGNLWDDYMEVKSIIQSRASTAAPASGPSSEESDSMVAQRDREIFQRYAEVVKSTGRSIQFQETGSRITYRINGGTASTFNAEISRDVMLRMHGIDIYQPTKGVA